MKQQVSDFQDQMMQLQQTIEQWSASYYAKHAEVMLPFFKRTCRLVVEIRHKSERYLWIYYCHFFQKKSHVISESRIPNANVNSN